MTRNSTGSEVERRFETAKGNGFLTGKLNLNQEEPKQESRSREQLQKTAVLEESGFVKRVQFEEGSKKVFCKSQAKVRVRVSVKVGECSESEGCLCLSLKCKGRAKKSCRC